MKAVLHWRILFVAGLVVCAAAGLRAQGVPYIYQPPVPSAAAPGGPGFTLTIRGAGFVAGAVIDWDGQPLATSFVSQAELTAAVPAAPISAAQTATVTVHNPGVPVASNFLYFQVHDPISSFHYVNAPNSPVNLGYQGGSPNFPYSIAAADLEGNGQTDLLMGMNTGRVMPGYVNFFAGSGDGTFAVPVSSTGVGEAPGAIALGDFTGNGRLDAAVANAYTAGGQPTVTVLLNNGDGTFSPAPGGPLPVGTLPMTILTADFNHDGKLDLAVACQNAIYVFLGDGDGTFVAAPGSPFAENGHGGVGLTIGDFNGDGNLDLAAAIGGDEINLFLGKGDGSFTPAPGDPIVAKAWFAGGIVAIAAADFNSDGKLDLFASQTGNQGVDVLLGNGDGTFTQPAVPVAGCCHDQIFNGIWGWNLVLGDFLANNRLDVAVVEENFNSGAAEDYINTYLGNGDGTFTPSDYSVLLPESPVTMITAGDFNGDGLLDLATASQPYPYYNVLLNQPSPGAAPDFSVSDPFPPTSTSIEQGQSATWGLGVSSLNGFTGPVLLACANLPAGATCAFTPADAPAATGPNPSVGGGVVYPALAPGDPPEELVPHLKIQTAAPTLVTPGGAAPHGGGPVATGGWLLALLLAGTAASLLAARRRRRALGWAVLGIALLASLGASSCSGNPPAPKPQPPQWVGGTPPGNYTITIQVVAYSGSPLEFSHTMPLTFTVTAIPGEAAASVGSPKYAQRQRQAPGLKAGRAAGRTGRPGAGAGARRPRAEARGTQAKACSTPGGPARERDRKQAGGIPRNSVQRERWRRRLSRRQRPSGAGWRRAREHASWPDAGRVPALQPRGGGAAGMLALPAGAQTRRLRLAAVLADVQEHAGGGEGGDQRGAAITDERQRNALGGHQADDHAEVDERLDGDHGGDAGGQQLPERIRRAPRHTHAPRHEQREQQHQRHGADQPQLLAGDGEDEIGVRLGQKEQLLPPVHQAQPGQTATAHGDQRLDDLEADALGVRPGMQKRQNALPPVGHAEHRPVQHRRRRQRAQGEIPPAQAGDVEHHRRDHGQRDGGSEVGLQQDQDAEQGQIGQDGAQRPPVVQFLAAAFQIPGQKQNERRLGDLRGLQGNGAEQNPAVCVVAAGQEKHQHQRRDGA